MYRYLCYKGHAVRSWTGEAQTAVCPDCGSLRIGARMDSQDLALDVPREPSPSQQGNVPVLIHVTPKLEEIDVLTRDEDDLTDTFDSVRPPTSFKVYAFIDEIQVTEGRDEDHYELAFTTIDSGWFNSLPESMEGVTPESWSLSAKVSKPARLELITSKTRLQEIIDKTSGEVSFHAGNWVWLELDTYDPQTFDGLGLPVTVFLSDGDRVASIGFAGPYPKPHLIVHISRIRPTSDGLRKLHRFKQAISSKD